MAYGAQQVKVSAEHFAAYDWAGRAIKRRRMEVRGAFGFRECTGEDPARFVDWLAGCARWSCRASAWRR
ncbi:hypothetical protein ABZ766_15850 [Streptomyces sp. NPDC006670]|uniref:hypothetical protein n=1 Tax=Streptomyces sp. NPDC006670 TaxID=3154476 RepID=UPI0033CCD9EC